jgi:hypothetical protein
MANNQDPFTSPDPKTRETHIKISDGSLLGMVEDAGDHVDLGDQEGQQRLLKTVGAVLEENLNLNGQKEKVMRLSINIVKINHDVLNNVILHRIFR